MRIILICLLLMVSVMSYATCMPMCVYDSEGHMHCTSVCSHQEQDLRESARDNDIFML